MDAGGEARFTYVFQESHPQGEGEAPRQTPAEGIACGGSQEGERRAAPHQSHIPFPGHG
jgi:hypothetical protein